MPVLILRPEPGATGTAERARAIGLEAIVAPLFAVAPVGWAPPPAEHFDAVMLTSANAARLGGPGLAAYRALPVYAVGAATAAAARDAGFTRVRAGAGDAAELVALLVTEGISRALHLCGAEHRPADHPATRIEPVVVYRAAPASELSEAARRAIVRGVTALLHSPRAAARFAELVPPGDRARIAVAAISPAAAGAAGPGWRALATASGPTDAALLVVAARLCEEAG